MREFKFRLWYGKEMNYLDDWMLPLNPTHSKAYYVCYAEDIGVNTSDVRLFASDDVIITQCIGMKDVNNKLIFESDIVEYLVEDIFGADNHIGRVEFLPSYLEYVIIRNGFNQLDKLVNSNTKNIKVIGNIFENADLLNG